MKHMFLQVSVALLGMSCAVMCQQQPKTVQPGAPGQATKTLPADNTAGARKPTEADVKFMQGMIMHHNQAVEMVGLLEIHSKNPDVDSLGQRIKISQTDEMRFMKRWLTERGFSTEMPGMDMSHMSAEEMKHMDMSMPPMPGMLTEAQMKELRAADGTKFDHLFLVGMVQHHTGALQMVKELFDTPGAGQDADLFDFTSDVDNTQKAEIQIMKGILLKEKQ